ncbi:MAG: META domain-containing protein [Chlorobiaceae bacterium]|nr:META domain-containing protein [Chlorobiaceae bacterium]NTW74793.1 META domain-containing protein [Chlorobiaceae bacterium]
MKNPQLRYLSILLLVLSLDHTTASASLAPCPTAASAGTSETSIDWPGFYWGILPCGNCSGFETTFMLRPDSTFRIEMRDIDRQAVPSVREGVYEWQPDGYRITCRENSGEVMQFFVSENRLYKLDANGKRIGGKLANRYILFKLSDGVTRIPNVQLRGTYWKLTTLLGKPVASVKGQREVHMMFRTCSSRIEGSGGCNNFFGTYELMPVNRIRFSKLGASLNSCSDMEVEQDLFSVLEQADSYRISGRTLQLKRASSDLLAQFEAVPKQ